MMGMEEPPRAEPVIVIENDQLVGMITLENLIEYIEISRTEG